VAVALPLKESGTTAIVSGLVSASSGATW
jgi:hypothetical protein